MVETVDVLVVGGGPAGALAAQAAAEAGAAVILVDKKRRLGAQPHCAEFVPRLLDTEVSIPPRAKVQPVIGMETRLSGGVGGFMDGPGWILDRQVFDHDLARRAAQAGARVWAGAGLRGRQGDDWLVRRAGRERRVRAGCLVAADGAGSFLARLLEMARPDLLVGRQVEVVLRQPLDHTVVWLEQRFTGGYAWLFPKGPVANLGLGVRAAAGPARLLEDLRGHLIDRGIIKPGVLAVTGGAIAVSGPRPELHQGRVLFCGDAAGLTHPVTGAGIPQAVFSGQEAGRAAAALAGGDFGAADQYAHQVTVRYGRYLQRGLEARRRWDQQWGQDDFSRLMRQTWPAWAGRAN